ncbi:hypothetical protein ACWEPM_23950 [Streptomyces sp. NPDC004244]
MRTIIAGLAEEAERQIRDRVWEMTATEQVVAGKTADDLSSAVGPPHVQEALAVIDRLAHLREALAALALSLAPSRPRSPRLVPREGDEALDRSTPQARGTTLPVRWCTASHTPWANHPPTTT